ncbi:MAG TPA: cytochrome C, partial [Geobacterales bacterium]|nr:cytochrome C [Geobacterales bacterium]
MKRRWLFSLVFLSLLILTVLLVPLVEQRGEVDQGCLACHAGIERVSASHSGCVSCHGGNPSASGKDEAHAGLRGGKNPSSPDAWRDSCGSCHKYQLERVRSSLMYTVSGMIRNIRLTWEGGESGRYASRGDTVPDENGRPVKLLPVTQLHDISGELFRKFCALCHVALENPYATPASHGSGCATCHFPWNNSATYSGGDPTVWGKTGHSSRHDLNPLPDITVCSRCHNRSGRIAYSYQGLYDGNNALVPTRNGLPGPIRVYRRNLTHILPDIHFARGLDCIDCHTSRDVMGDGYSYPNLYRQVEVSCADCHGDGERAPRSRVMASEGEEALRESRSYSVPARPGMEMVLTAKGRPYSNVFAADGHVWVVGKRSGRLHRSPVITGTPEHTVAGHGRLECFTCHSRTVVQCYGCHTTYNKGKLGYDFVRQEDTPGEFTETEDYRQLYPFPLAVNQRGRISTVTPGCQTFVTVMDEEGVARKPEYVTRFRGKQQLRFAPF